MIWWLTAIAAIVLLVWSGNWGAAIFWIVFWLLAWFVVSWIVHVADTDKTNKP